MSESAIQSISDLIRQEHYEQAEALCLKYFNKETDPHIYCTLLGEIYLRQGRSMEGQLFFEKAVEVMPGYEPAQYGLEQIEMFIELLKQPIGIIVQKYSDEDLSDEQFLTLYRMLRETERRREIIDSIKNRVQINEKNWKTFWHFAKEAKFFEQYEALEHFCEQILSIHPEFTYAAELPKHFRGYYAPADIDNFLEEYFEATPPQNRIFIDVGSFDGTFHSQVRRLYESAGWRGVCIEPDPISYSQLVQIYTDGQVQCFNYEIGASEVGDQNFEVPLRTLTAVIEETGIQEIDFLSINTAAASLPILNGLDLNFIQPQLIAVKTNPENVDTERYLTKFGYQIVHTAPKYVYFQSAMQFSSAEGALQPKLQHNAKPVIEKKIIALVPEVTYTPHFDIFIHSLALFVDGIILHRDKNAKRRHILSKRIIQDCKIIGVVELPGDDPINEILDKMLLLGRKKRGTHFIVLYPGEIISANTLENDLFRNTILQLTPGDTITMPVVTLTNGLQQYLADHETGGLWQKAAFADDGIASYYESLSDFSRLPVIGRGTEYRLEGIRFCLLDTRFVNEENIKINRAWETFAKKLGYVLPEPLPATIYPGKGANEIAPAEWFAGNNYCIDAMFSTPDVVSLRVIYTWFNEYGVDYFSDVDDSGLDWRSYAALATSTPDVVEEEEPHKEKNQVLEMMLLDVESALQRQNYDYAEEVLAEILMEDPGNVEALNDYAVLKILTEEFHYAEQILQQLLLIDPDNEMAQENLAYLRKIGKLG